MNTSGAAAVQGLPYGDGVPLGLIGIGQPEEIDEKVLDAHRGQGFGVGATSFPFGAEIQTRAHE